MRYWHKDRHTAQSNNTENSEINPYIYGQLTFNKGAKTMREEPLQQMVLEQLDIHIQKNAFGTIPQTIQEIN